jgi:hypothetical protein
VANISERKCRRALALCVVWIWVGCSEETARRPESLRDAGSREDSAAPSSPARVDAGKEDAVSVRTAALSRAQTCSEVERLVKREALEHMNASYDEWERSARLQAISVPDRCMSVTFKPRTIDRLRPRPPRVPSNMIAWSRPTDDRANAASASNNQVAGVDEADFIKNDDKYVYAAMNGAFRIIEAWPAETAHEIANVKLDGEPRKLFVAGDRALVYVARERGTTATVRASLNECTYGYDCDFRGDGTATTILLFDISERAAPKQLHRLDVSASLLAARRIGDAVHTVLVTPELVFPDVLYPSVGPTACPSGMTVAASFEATFTALEEQRAANEALIAETLVDELLPLIQEDGRDVDVSRYCDSVYGETLRTGSALTTLLSLSLSDAKPAAVTTIVSKPGAVYATPEALYLAINERTPKAFRTIIHKLDLQEDVERTAYAASGQVEGNVLNQFSLDEHKGYLRVATSFGKVPEQGVHSALSVLEQRADALELVGKVDDIAPREDIRSVRFDGDRGFIVTFKKTDPLYAFDLSDPARPVITGELKIPGFSTYMHMLDEKHLLTVGYDAEDSSGWAYFSGVLLQLFDVSDMTAPALAHKLVIGTRGSSSQALTDHLAFTLFGDKLALPMSVCEESDEQSSSPGHMTFGGLMVFDVSVEQGISERGRVAHPGANGIYDDTACSGSWTKARSTVKRSVFMDNYVYSISSDTLRVQAVESLGNDVTQVPLQD